MAINPAARMDLIAFNQPPDGSEVLRYSYYSRKAITGGAVWPADLQFFSDQQGVAGATIRDTNMTKGSAIGNPRRFLAQYLNLNIYSVVKAEVIAVAVVQDLQEALMQTVVKITVLDKEYLTVPSWVVPAGGGLVVSIGGHATALMATNGNADKRNAYPIEINLEREASFSVNLLSPVAITPVKNLYAEFVLTGLLLRPKQ